ncbi:MAG TPA: BON domain-containing protein [Chloroflexota bacterium]|nr:BON domain-containing protein [Chloroflexota bacterium]
MPYGNPTMSGCCPQCGSPTGPSAGFAGQTMPGTFAPSMGYAPQGMGFGAPGMGAGMGFGGMSPAALANPNLNPYWLSPAGLGWGLGGVRRWGGTYTPQFLMTGLPTDNEIVEMVYDSIDADPIIPFDAAIDVDSDAGVVALTGTVATKEIKHAAGDDAWWIPGVDDVHNQLQVERRPARAAAAQRAATPTAPSRHRAQTSAEEEQGAETGQPGRATATSGGTRLR